MIIIFVLHFFVANVEKISRFAFSGCEDLTEIHYNGTKAQWENIDKDKAWGRWDEDLPGYTVVCTDGIIRGN